VCFQSFFSLSTLTGMREFVPLPIRLLLSLLMLLLKLALIMFVLLPFNIIMFMVCTSGICVAFSALWIVRSLAWFSACVVLICMHICCSVLSFARASVDWCYKLTIRGKHKLTVTPPPAQLPSPSFHDIRALHAYVIAKSDASNGSSYTVIAQYHMHPYTPPFCA
jgi:hypothetical protein